MFSRDNLELIILAILVGVGVLGLVALTVMQAEIPELLIGIVGTIVGAFLKEIGETGQLTKSERVLGGQTLVEVGHTRQS